MVALTAGLVEDPMNIEPPDHFTNAIISPRLQASLEAQAIRERLLTRSDYALGELFDIPSGYGSAGDKRVLTYLCLFPSITVTRSDFDLNKLTGAGLSGALIEPRTIRKANFCVADNLLEPSEFDSLAKISHQQALQICKSQEREFIALIEEAVALDPRQLISTDVHALSGTKRICRRSFIGTVRVLANWYTQDHAATPFQGIGAEEAIAKTCNIPLSVFRADNVYLEAWLDKVDDFYIRLASTIFYSNWKAQTLSVGRWWGKKAELETRPDVALDAAEVLVQFREELRVVPLPRTIGEAAEIAKSKEMVRIRELVGRWLDAAHESNERIEQLIRKDIAKASAELRRLKRFKELSESPFVFGLKLLAGQVPVVSNVVTIADAAGWMYERWVSKRNCWVAIKN